MVELVQRPGWFGVRLRPDRRFEVLDALHLVTADGWPASTEEILQKAGMTSKKTVHDDLKTLIAEGLVQQHPRRPRGGYMPVRS